ncbi:MAG: DUF3237 domain-containing protein [Acidimicrobiales bacterium]|jgi:hypothetical protein|nr:DUF3237 domain-containing protein [Acidimicrobiales bacterium]
MANKQLDVEHLFTLDLQVGEGVQIIKGGPHGTRMIAEVAGGTFTGERLTGSVVPPGGDWVTARADRNIQLDVRLTLVTDDDAVILMQYKGIADPAAGVARSAPQFETGDDRYTWLNNVQGVGIGQLHPEGGVTYEVYSLTQLP